MRSRLIRDIGCHGALAWFAIFVLAGEARAQTPPPSPPPASTGNVSSATTGGLLDAGGQFLQQLGQNATGAYTGPALTATPGGGGADLDVIAQKAGRYRAWFEGYGIAQRMRAQGDFTGDRRATFGGVAGLGVNLTPGLSVGASVDQSRTHIAISDLPQSGNVDLTQVGLTAALESGGWTFGVAGVYGFGKVKSQREDAGISTASYDANLWGALAELSYLWTSGDWRVVPKLAVDWTRTETDPFTEIGGAAPVAASGVVSRRTRFFAGAEIGHTWYSERGMFDLSGYGRFVDNVSQDIGALQVTGAAALPRLIQGVAETRLGADAGASATYRLSSNARAYAAYDGRFRGNLTAHGGTIGIELRW